MPDGCIQYLPDFNSGPDILSIKNPALKNPVTAIRMKTTQATQRYTERSPMMLYRVLDGTMGSCAIIILSFRSKLLILATMIPAGSNFAFKC